MSCLPIVSDSCDQREQVFRVGAAAPRVFNSKYLFSYVLLAVPMLHTCKSAWESP